MWKWATIVGLSMTPNLFVGSSAACIAAYAWGFDPWIYVPVIAASSFVEGLAVVWLARLARRIGGLERFLARWHTPRAVAWSNRWGPLGGLAIGPAVLGQEPILIALVWMDVPARRLIVPLAISNLVYTILYYLIAVAGLGSLFGV